MLIWTVFISREDLDRYDFLCDWIDRVIQCNDFIFDYSAKIYELLKRQLIKVKNNSDDIESRMRLMDLVLIVGKNEYEAVRAGIYEVGHWQVQYLKKNPGIGIEGKIHYHIADLYDAEYFLCEGATAAALNKYYSFMNWEELITDTYRDPYAQRGLYMLGYAVAMNILMIYKMFGLKEKAQSTLELFGDQFRSLENDLNTLIAASIKRGLDTSDFRAFQSVLNAEPIATKPDSKVRQLTTEEQGIMFFLSNLPYLSVEEGFDGIISSNKRSWITETLILTDDSFTWMFPEETTRGFLSVYKERLTAYCNHEDYPFDFPFMGSVEHLGRGPFLAEFKNYPKPFNLIVFEESIIEQLPIRRQDDNNLEDKFIDSFDAHQLVRERDFDDYRY